MWIDLDTVIPSEIGQREKKKYHILIHIRGTWRNWYRWSYLQSRKRDRCREQTCGYQGGKGGAWGELEDWDWYIYTIDTMHNVDN